MTEEGARPQGPDLPEIRVLTLGLKRKLDLALPSPLHIVSASYPKKEEVSPKLFSPESFQSHC